MLMEHQKKGVELIKKYDGVLLNFEMGTGKTRTAIYAFKNEGALIVAPARVIPDWVYELNKVGENDIEVVKTAKSYTGSKKWTIVSYDILKTITPQVKNLVLDESHYIKASPKRSKKTGKPNRSKAVLDIAKQANKIVALTGTAITNKPKDLWNQLVAIRHPLIDIGKTAFSKRYCGGELRRMRGRFFWWDEGATNIDELRMLLGEQVMVVKRSEVLDLPKLHVIEKWIELNKSERKAYEEAFNDYLKWIEENAEEAVNDWQEKVEHYKLQGFPEEYAIITLLGEEINKRIQHQAIIKTIKTRQITSMAKAEYILEIQDEIQGQAIIFTEFNETKDFLLKELDAVSLDDVEKFKSGYSKFLVSNIVAGGTGINLQNASTVIIVDQNWTPAINEQAIARAYRMGQDKPVTALFLKVRDTIDEVVSEKNKEKQSIIDRIIT